MNCSTDCLVFLFQWTALLSTLLAWYAYRVTHVVNKDKPIFRIEEVRFGDGMVGYYCCRRWPFNRWKSFEIDGKNGYSSKKDARTALERYLKQTLGFELSETKVVKEYG